MYVITSKDVLYLQDSNHSMMVCFPAQATQQSNIVRHILKFFCNFVDL